MINATSGFTRMRPRSGKKRFTPASRTRQQTLTQIDFVKRYSPREDADLAFEVDHIRSPKAKRRRKNLKQDDFREVPPCIFTSPEDRRAGTPDCKEQRIGDEDPFEKPTEITPEAPFLPTLSTAVARRAAQESIAEASALNEASTNLQDCRSPTHWRTSGTRQRLQFEVKDSYASDNGGNMVLGSRLFDSSNATDITSSLGILENKENSMVQAIVHPVVRSFGQIEYCAGQEIEHISHKKTTNTSKRRLPNSGPRLEVQDSELESSDEDEVTLSGDAGPESQWPVDGLGLDVDAERCLQETSDDSSSDYIIGSDTQATIQDQERLLDTRGRKRDRGVGDMRANLASERPVTIGPATDAFQGSDHHSAGASLVRGLPSTKPPKTRGNHHDHFENADFVTKNGSGTSQDMIRSISASSPRDNASFPEKGSRHLHLSREGEQRARSGGPPSSTLGPSEDASNMVKSIPPTTPEEPIRNRNPSSLPPRAIPSSVSTPQTFESTKRKRHPSWFSQLDLASMTQLLPESLMNDFLPMPPLTQDSTGGERR